MKLPVVTGGDEVKAFRKVGYESTSNTVATSSYATPTNRIDASPFPTTKNLPKAPCER